MNTVRGLMTDATPESGLMPWKRNRTQRRSDAQGGISLLRRRSWYAEGDGADAPPADDPPTEEGADAPPPPPPSDLETELAELNAIKEKSESKIAELNAEAKRRRLENEDILKSTGSWERLATEREAEVLRLQAQLESMAPFKERYEAHLVNLKAQNEVRVSELPETSQDLVPEYDSPEKTAAYLNRHWAKLMGRPAPNLDGGAGGGGKRRPESKAADIDRQQADLASGYGITIDPEALAKRRQNRNQNE